MLDRVHSIAITVGAIAWAAFAAQPAAAHHPGPGPHGPDNASAGLVHADLVQATDPRCRGLLMGARSGVCTHGPDPAPAGRDVRNVPSTAAVRAAAGLSPIGSVANTTPGTTTPPTDGSGAIVCSGDGVAGKRVEVLYVVPSDKTDRYDRSRTRSASTSSAPTASSTNRPWRRRAAATGAS